MRFLLDRGLQGSTLVSSLEGSVLTEQEGEHVARNRMDILKLYEDALRPLHEIRSDCFSPGIYSFMASGEQPGDSPYEEYLLRELNALAEAAGGRDSLEDSMYEAVLKGLRQMPAGPADPRGFCLLHGDLYAGNILSCDGRYALIDFEYLRFGPKEMEWAFLLFWDMVCESRPRRREEYRAKATEELRALTRAGILDRESIRKITGIFLPALLLAAHISCRRKLYREHERLREEIESFWREEYRLLAEGK